jgi:DNA-binding NarL/FixJ family response regulator
VTAAVRPLRVAVVEDHPLTAAGMQAALAGDDDRRFRVVGSFTSVAGLDPAVSGTAFDVCVLDLVGVGDEREILGLLARPAVVCTAGQPGPLFVALWVRGARAVLTKTVVGSPLADAVWYAVHDPYVVAPQLARALLDCVEAGAVEAGDLQRRILAAACVGDLPETICAELGIDRPRHAAQIDALRSACAAAGLGAVELAGALGDVPAAAGRPDSSRPAAGRSGAGRLRPEQRPTRQQQKMLELLADGCTEEEIAEKLSLEQVTIRNTLRDALKRAGIGRRDQPLRIFYALFVTGRHRDPDVLWERLRRHMDETI